MTPHKQLSKHDPENGVYGDCGRTVIACLLDLHPSEVPHFFDKGPEESPEAYANERAWLAERGLLVVKWCYEGNTLEEVLGSMKYTNPAVTYILMGQSPRGVNHVVICRDDQVLHDPSIQGGGLVGPADDGRWWIEVIAHIKGD